MSKAGHEYLNALVGRHGDVPAELLDNPLLQGEPVSLAGVEISIRRGVVPPDGAQLELIEGLRPAINLERAIAQSGGFNARSFSTEAELRDTVPSWEVLRNSMRPPNLYTGKLTNFSLELISPAEVTHAALGKLLRPSTRYETVPNTDLLVKVTGEMGRTALACGLGIRLRYPPEDGFKYAYLGMWVGKLPKARLRADLEVAERNDAAMLRNARRAAVPLSGGFETKRQRH